MEINLQQADMILNFAVFVQSEKYLSEAEWLFIQEILNKFPELKEKCKYKPLDNRLGW
jgi:hypothetical protein